MLYRQTLSRVIVIIKKDFSKLEVTINNQKIVYSYGTNNKIGRLDIVLNDHFLDNILFTVRNYKTEYIKYKS